MHKVLNRDHLEDLRVDEMIILKFILNKKFWEELSAYIPSIQHSPYRKRVHQFFYHCAHSLLRLHFY
jgi:hypothetical protein